MLLPHGADAGGLEVERGREERPGVGLRGSEKICSAEPSSTTWPSCMTST
jgi:hypothetical protein